MGAIALSRFGLWGFDLCQVNIMQSSIEAEIRGVINGTERALTQVAWLFVCFFFFVFFFFFFFLFFFFFFLNMTLTSLSYHHFFLLDIIFGNNSFEPFSIWYSCCYFCFFCWSGKFIILSILFYCSTGGKRGNN